ncbi:SRPBCC domain-containing protein [Azospirillum isscasi]|uniref:SRPBCC domain-containing protein n=1 Tax=Azospirillum isscasi TaxID=3053926 RepID=A0ABU0WFM7_9PROT|nr:SRPBCC domain-containing protein [Azospirillum isscasi]MDQ2102887.1 SRPBCC domain-containing protein [Azospirillum isscasi]
MSPFSGIPGHAVRCGMLTLRLASGFALRHNRPMMQIDTIIGIDASPAVVWGVLTDFAAYPSWNPFIVNIEGIAGAGERLTIRVVPHGQKGMAFRPRVLVADPERQLRWRGRLILPGLFDGEHIFRIEPVAAGVRFHHSERFTGLLPHMMPASSFDAVRKGFEAMNEALKQRAEARKKH